MGNTPPKKPQQTAEWRGRYIIVLTKFISNTMLNVPFQLYQLYMAGMDKIFVGFGIAVSTAIIAYAIFSFKIIPGLVGLTFLTFSLYFGSKLRHLNCNEQQRELNKELATEVGDLRKIKEQFLEISAESIAQAEARISRLKEEEQAHARIIVGLEKREEVLREITVELKKETLKTGRENTRFNESNSTLENIAIKFNRVVSYAFDQVSNKTTDDNLSSPTGYMGHASVQSKV